MNAVASVAAPVIPGAVLVTKPAGKVPVAAVALQANASPNLFLELIGLLGGVPVDSQVSGAKEAAEPQTPAQTLSGVVVASPEKLAEAILRSMFTRNLRHDVGEDPGPTVGSLATEIGVAVGPSVLEPQVALEGVASPTMATTTPSTLPPNKTDKEKSKLSEAITPPIATPAIEQSLGQILQPAPKIVPATNAPIATERRGAPTPVASVPTSATSGMRVLELANATKPNAPVAFELQVTPMKEGKPEALPVPQTSHSVVPALVTARTPGPASKPALTAVSAPSKQPALVSTATEKGDPSISASVEGKLDKPAPDQSADRQAGGQRDNSGEPPRKTSEHVDGHRANAIEIQPNLAVAPPSAGMTQPEVPAAASKASTSEVPRDLEAAPVPTATEPPATSPAKELSLRVDTPGSAPVDVHVAQRGGEVHVEVRTHDANLGETLRQDLGSLLDNLHQAGYRAEVQNQSPSASLLRSTSDARAIDIGGYQANSVHGKSATLESSNSDPGAGDGSPRQQQSGRDTGQRQQQHRRPDTQFSLAGSPSDFGTENPLESETLAL